MIQTKRSGRLQRLGSEDLSIAGEILKAATQYLVPEDMTQRQAFAAYMPEIYVLRNKGCSFAQITTLLSECGFKLQPSTVRIYYSELLADRLDECQRRMNEQILLMNEVRKETNVVNSASISAKLAEINNKQRKDAAQKIEKLFGVKSSEKSPPLTSALPELTVPVSTHSKDEKSTNLLMEDEPAVPVLNIKNNLSDFSSQPPKTRVKKNLATSPHPEKLNDEHKLKCLPLQSGIKPLQKKPTVPEYVYQPGNLEHPAIPGLMLSLQQRLYGVALEYKNHESGEVLFESLQEKRFRVFWQKPVPMTPSATSDNFVKMDQSLFTKR